MREIKFRAWDIELNEWNIFNFPRCIDQDNMNSIDDYENWCQFTGLKDKNGKEIYDGDIVINSNLGIKGYKNIGLNGNVVNIFDWANMRYLTEYVNEDEREVIGNIFENPNLLNNK